MAYTESMTSELPACELATVNFDCMPSHERRDAWHAAMQPFWNIKPNEYQPSCDWGGELRLAVDGEAIISTAAAPGLIFERDWAHIRGGGLDQILVQVYGSGGFHGACGERDVTLRPGDIGFLDLAQPFRTAELASTSVTLAVPRERLVAVLQGEGLHGLVVQRTSVSARLIGCHLRAMAESIQSLTSSEASAAVDAAVALIAGAWRRFKDGPAAPRHAAYATLRRMICDHIEIHLQDFDLDPGRLCKEFRLSRATLYRMFEIDGGIAAHIQERRLRRCFDILSRPGDQGWRERIADLAFAYGFSSESHFSRAFRRRFGMTPGEARSLSDQNRWRHSGSSPMVDWLDALRAYNSILS